MGNPGLIGVASSEKGNSVHTKESKTPVLFRLSVILTALLLMSGTIGTNQPVNAAYPVVPEINLTDINPVTGDEFGSAIAVSGDTVIVGAPVANLRRGAAYVFIRSGSAWTQEVELTADDAYIYDGFGVSVSVSGNTAVVGTSGRAAYVFVHSGSSWAQVIYWTLKLYLRLNDVRFTI